MVTKTRIGRLSVRGGQHGTHTRLRVNHLLNSADIRPSTLPPTAVFLVRRLTDPLPGQMAESGAVRVRTPWETAVRHRLAQQVSQAVRPQIGWLPPDADAVLFSDEAEMLACLSLALRHGIAHQRWWWRRLLPQLANQTISGLWRERPHQLPAILHILTRWHKAEPLLTTLSSAAAATILHTLAKAYGVPNFQTVQEKPFISQSEQRNRELDRVKTQQFPAAAPWAAWVDAVEMPGQLTVAQMLLLGVGLMLHRRPTAVTTPAFAQSVHYWQEAQLEIKTLASAGDLGATKPSEFDQADINPDAETDSRNEASSETAVSPKHGTLDAKPVDALLETATRQSGLDQPIAPPLTAQLVYNEPEQEAVPPVPIAQGTRPQSFAEGVETQLGGIFYLCNVMQRLRLLDSFDPAFALTQQIGPWGVLEVLARALLGKRHQSLRTDPVWKALATLDGRLPTQLPGINFHLPGEPTIPTAWISDSAWPMFNQQNLAKRPFLQSINPFLLEWLMLVLPRISHHLYTVLHLDDPVNLSDLGQTVLVLNGRLFVTTTHVDLLFRLEGISLPLRMAGLDIDPGWVPALGRVVQFHFR